MLKIRKKQIVALRDAKARQFEERVLPHLRKVFPASCDRLGEDKVRATIRNGIKRAEDYQFETERDICKYIDLMFVFGNDFDRDPNLPWATELLQDRGTRGGMTQMERLCRAALDHLQSNGDGNVRT